MGSACHTSAATEPLKCYYSVLTCCLNNYEHFFFFNWCFAFGFRLLVLCIPPFCKPIKQRNTEISYSGFTFWTSSLVSYNVLLFAPFPKEDTNPADLPGAICLRSIVQWWAAKLSHLMSNLQTLCTNSCVIKSLTNLDIKNRNLLET